MAGIFKAYDIRGLTTNISDELAYSIGLGFFDLISKEQEGQLTFVVGQDMRETSDRYAVAVMDALVDSGANVIDLGLISTPMFYYACATLDISGGVMVTASHNPAAYNGFKFCRAKAGNVTYENGINHIETFVASEHETDLTPKGSIEKKDILKDYIGYLLPFVNVDRPLKIVIDAGNGMGGLEVPALLENVPDVEVVSLYTTLDGTFPNHEANPILEENLEDLKNKVIETGAHFGAAFDGDADRVIFVDELGRTVPAYFALALFAQESLSHKKTAIVHDLLASKATDTVITQAGGTPIVSRVGRSFIQQHMIQHDAPLGGELSGHMLFKDFYMCDNANLALIYMLNIISNRDAKLSELIEPMRTYAHAGQINVEVKDADATLEKFHDEFKDKLTLDIDGYSFDLGDYWFNIRKSNTEPLVRITLEAKDDAHLEKGREIIMKLLA